MTNKERAGLKARAMSIDSIFQIGKLGVTPQLVKAVSDALKARELVKLGVLKSCGDDVHEIAGIVSERTGAQIVQVVGRKIVLYKKNYKKEAARRNQSLKKGRVGKKQGKKKYVYGGNRT